MDTKQAYRHDLFAGAREHHISRRAALGRFAGLGAVAALTGAGLGTEPAAPSACARSSTAQAQPAVSSSNVVLVHGAYADGSCWSEVIGRLQLVGLNVTSVQNPLTSLADDVAATQRALALQDGPTVLVGHSWAGTIISEAAVDPKIAALVYVAARAPDAGEDYPALAAKFPRPPASDGLVTSDGF